jgi:hypothetical protein
LTMDVEVELAGGVGQGTSVGSDDPPQAMAEAISPKVATTSNIRLRL